jgi:peptidoglycan/xylan/chitin deacetylase (PgdA/CDA1 family)
MNPPARPNMQPASNKNTGPQRYKVSLFLITLFLAALIAFGSLYLESEPRLSSRALISKFKRIYLTAKYSSLREQHILNQPAARSIPVLTYHRLENDGNDSSNVSVKLFEDQMITLKKAGWQTVTLQQFEDFMNGKISIQEKSFLLTFDDGAKDSYYPADPILSALGYHGVIFVIAAQSLNPRSTYYLTQKELRNMLNTGRWSIGSHSYDGHRPYPTSVSGTTGVFFADRLWLPDQNRLETEQEFASRVKEDLSKAKNNLEDSFGIPIVSFAFPLGNETGIEGANNYPSGSKVTESIAGSIYSFGFLQTNKQQFTANIPAIVTLSGSSPSSTSNTLERQFLIYRIHVDYDWGGARLLSILENALPKKIPYEDDFSTNRGWISSWGEQSIGRNNFQISAANSFTSASSFLDGTELWDNYTFDVTANWSGSYFFLLGNVKNAKTYDACVFSPGQVRIESVTNGIARTLLTKRTSVVDFGTSVHAGMRVHGAVIECTWDYTAIAEVYERVHSGGVGIQVWDEVPSVAKLQVSSVIVRQFDS